MIARPFRLVLTLMSITFTSIHLVGVAFAQGVPTSSPNVIKEQNTLLSDNIDRATINAAFFSSPNTVAKKIAEGKKYAEKGRMVSDFMSRYDHQLKVTRGNKETASGRVYPIGIGGNELIMSSYNKARLYEPLNLPERVLSNGAYPRSMVFNIVIVSQPKVGAPRGQGIANALNAFAALGNPSGQHDPIMNRLEVKKDANASEVDVIKFVVTDDEGNVYQVVPSNVDTTSGNVTVTTIEKQPGATVHTEEKASASDGATVTAQGNYTVSDYVPYSSDHPYYKAVYRLIFPLYDANGRGRISPRAKSMTLHAVTPVGELAADFKLKDYAD